MLLTVTLNPFVLPPQREPAPRQVIYKAMPKIAKRPPARTGVAYCPSEAAAAWLAAAEAPLAPAEVAEAAAPLVREAEPETELEAPGEFALVVRVPQFAFMAVSQSAFC
jgi:hypothetical protein